MHEPAQAGTDAAATGVAALVAGVHTREELGVDPQELPSAVLAGVASLLAFALGPWCRCCPGWRPAVAGGRQRRSRRKGCGGLNQLLTVNVETA